MSDTFDFYGDDAEESSVRKIKGITDDVSQYVYTDMEYPCICLKKDLVLPKHKWNVISKLVKPSAMEKNIALYVCRGESIFKVGYLAGVQVKSFIDIIGLENMLGYYKKDKVLEGDRLYILSD